MSKPARPDLRFTTFDEMIADADRLRSGPYDKAGEWDLGMILDHLAKMMAKPFLPSGKSFPWPATIATRWVIHQIAKRKSYPEVRFIAPPSVRPTVGVDAESAYLAFSAAARKLDSFNASTIHAPPFGVLPTQDFKAVQLLHGSHHLGFLKSRA